MIIIIIIIINCEIKIFTIYNKIYFIIDFFSGCKIITIFYSGSKLIKYKNY